jgi:hypothetical protein
MGHGGKQVAARSVHVGLNRVSAAHYGSEQPLRGAVADAEAMRAIAGANGFTATLLLNEAATVLAVSQAIAAAAAQLRVGDTFFLSYAGHGSQLFDGAGDEPDSLDETLCLFDRMLLDDELHGLLLGFDAGVRVLVITDSCHSASATRLMVDPAAEEFPNGIIGPAYPALDEVRFRHIEEEVAREIYGASAPRYDEARLLAGASRQADLRCAKVHLAACQDNQLAADASDHGYFTKQLLHHWDQGAFAGSYDDLFRALDRAMPRRQRPNLETGGDAALFVSQRPFSI